MAVRKTEDGIIADGKDVDGAGGAGYILGTRHRRGENEAAMRLRAAARGTRLGDGSGVAASWWRGPRLFVSAPIGLALSPLEADSERRSGDFGVELG